MMSSVVTSEMSSWMTMIFRSNDLRMGEWD